MDVEKCFSIMKPKAERGKQIVENSAREICEIRVYLIVNPEQRHDELRLNCAGMKSEEEMEACIKDYTVLEIDALK